MEQVNKVQKYMSALPLLSKEDSRESIDEEEYAVRSKNADDRCECGEARGSKQRHQVWWYVHMGAFVIYTVIYLLVLGPQAYIKFKTGQTLPLPAREALQPELRHFPTLLEGNPFTGAPRKELDHAWHKLLQNDNIRLPQSAIKALDLKSVTIKNSHEGVASLSVYHALHCVKKVRQMMYKEHYHAGKDKMKMMRETRHADHCVEYLRESLMCKPDLSLITFRWINDTSQHPDHPDAFYPTNFDTGLHECMNWDSLDAWTGKRVFDLYDVDALDRPTS